MARTSSDIVINAPAARIMDAIAAFADYPRWATGVQVADIVKDGSQGRARQVHFVLDAAPIRDEYDLLYDWSGDQAVSWKLAEPGAVLTSLEGSYLLVPEPSGTRVTYQLAVNVRIPLLGKLKHKAEKVIIDSALKGLKKHVEALCD